MNELIIKYESFLKVCKKDLDNHLQGGGMSAAPYIYVDMVESFLKDLYLQKKKEETNGK